MITLGDINGPPCPECHCRDTLAAGPVRKAWGKPSQQRRCRACGHEWLETTTALEAEADTVPVVKVYAVRCPKCLSKEVRSTGKRERIRYHVCGRCGQRFKSLEDDQ